MSWANEESSREAGERERGTNAGRHASKHFGYSSDYSEKEDEGYQGVRKIPVSVGLGWGEMSQPQPTKGKEAAGYTRPGESCGQAAFLQGDPTDGPSQDGMRRGNANVMAIETAASLQASHVAKVRGGTWSASKLESKKRDLHPRTKGPGMDRGTHLSVPDSPAESPAALTPNDESEHPVSMDSSGMRARPHETTWSVKVTAFTRMSCLQVRNDSDRRQEPNIIQLAVYYSGTAGENTSARAECSLGDR